MSRSRAEKSLPSVVQSQDHERSFPVQRQCPEVTCKTVIEPGLMPVSRAARALRAQCPADVDRQPVVDLVGRIYTALALRHLHGRPLTGCDVVGVETVAAPGELDRGGVLAAPSTEAVDKPLSLGSGP